MGTSWQQWPTVLPLTWMRNIPWYRSQSGKCSYKRSVHFASGRVLNLMPIADEFPLMLRLRNTAVVAWPPTGSRAPWGLVRTWYHDFLFHIFLFDVNHFGAKRHKIAGVALTPDGGDYFDIICPGQLYQQPGTPELPAVSNNHSPDRRLTRSSSPHAVKGLRTACAALSPEIKR